MVVGTSAGATTAVSLRAGVSATDLHASYTRTPLSDEGQDIMNRVTTPLDLGSSSDGEPLDGARRSSRRPANQMLLLRDLCSTARPRPVMALAGLLPVVLRLRGLEVASFGASLQGGTPLLTMLSTCAPGIGVVNIDNGFGAATIASIINHLE